MLLKGQQLGGSSFHPAVCYKNRIGLEENMIIYGYRNRVIEQGTGNFYCPNCQAQRQYKRKKIVRYFTLFFIPIFPLGTLSEYIECGVCGRTYKPEILSVPAPTAVITSSPSITDPAGRSFLQSAVVDEPVSEPKAEPKPESRPAVGRRGDLLF